MLVLSRFATAVVVYVAFAAYLFLPHLKNFDRLQYLLPINVCLGCLGCYVLSRRWVGAFFGSLFAGAIYGFGPYTLGLLKFHPAATLLAAAIPWLFCPAAFIVRRQSPAMDDGVQKRKWHLPSMLLSTLPFAAIILFFRAAIYLRLFPIPTQAHIHLSDLASLLAPLAMVGPAPAAAFAETSRNIILVGFYHVPVAALIMGFLMLFVARRFGVLIIFCLGIILAWCQSLLDVNPIIWLTIPVLCCSVLIGEGMQGLALASEADRKWILAIIVSMGILAIVTLLLATIPDLQLSIGNQQSHIEDLILQSAKMYVLGALTVSIIFFMARAKKRLLILRWLVLCSAMAVDIFLCARFIIDRIL